MRDLKYALRRLAILPPWRPRGAAAWCAWAVLEPAHIGAGPACLRRAGAPRRAEDAPARIAPGDERRGAGGAASGAVRDRRAAA